MSLISDTDYLIHSLRLNYLRDVEDPYGRRLISLDSSYTSNPYILAASLADVDRWPELAMPSSPQISDDEEQQPGAGAKGLKYTQTIMGGRTGGLGLRVSGKRASVSKRASTLLSSTTEPDVVKNFVGTSAPVNEEAEVEEVAEGTPEIKVQEAPPVVEAPQFVPRFKGAAEMERRRRLRMAARRGPDAAPPPGPPPTLSFDDSSSDEDNAVSSSSSSSTSYGANDSMDDDDFDPEFAATTTRTPGNFDSASDMNSMLSLSNSRRSRPRLTPASGKLSPNRPRAESRPHRPQRNPTTEMSFTRKRIVPPKPPAVSALSAMLKSAGTTTNPFSELYSLISGRGENASSYVQVYFPHAQGPRNKAMELSVRKDASVEEVIGFALWTYWEEGWKPKLDEGLTEEDEKWNTQLSAIGWILRIAEDDGEVDDDFPPPDRMGKIVKFNADAYAVLEANPAQVAQNRILQSKIQRRPSRTAVAKKPQNQNQNPGSLPPAATTGAPVFGSNLGSLPLSTSLGLSSSGPQMFLRIRVADAADAGHISTTIPVSAEMYMQEALEMVCRKRKLDNPKEYALLLADMSILIPLDRTVASLQGKRELVIIKKSRLGGDVLKGAGRTTDPNASIFKRISDTPEVKLSSALDYTAAYKKYTISRKMPMLVAKQEKTLAIDGVYIHIMPSTNKAKAVFDNGKTYSYHIKSIVDCQQSTKSSNIFKLVLTGNKRYDFEAESPKAAGEIVQTIRGMRAALERSGTVNRSRRSRHGGAG
ncbi:stress-activated map kinase interacting protein 1-domain-containing protein [Desarmillaria tabescens]|uniref:Stress-activated map kinase interacting protein 1-domain-containing protein n=1 Tax=Armillaria tabescens TaxID=1929756 RepID=A0AA39JLH1_ARMTA|nr:stress-activated map kinase interacting protein 1-domain-containing protein [Desarmillaria tabescens]KAK0444951.1 stress-activated map kinase interacting protein 1-domain-containing protein [Desarmillaria tabescens]